MSTLHIHKTEGAASLPSMLGNLSAIYHYRRLRLDGNDGTPYNREFEHMEVSCFTRQASNRQVYRLSSQHLSSTPAQPLENALNPE